MKLPNKYKNSFFVLNWKPICLIWISTVLFFFAANLLLNFIDFITNFINTL